MIFVCFLFNKIKLEQWILFLRSFPLCSLVSASVTHLGPGAYLGVCGRF